MTMLTQERLKELFDYNPETGLLSNRITRNSRALKGREAGCINERGYRQVWVDGTKYYEHRVIWCLVTGQRPVNIDHWNGIRSDNRWVNLREADRSQTCWNAEGKGVLSAPRGVNRRGDRPKWRAQISARGRSYHLGDFDTIDEAQQAYRDAAKRLHGEFAFHNRPKL